MAISLDTTGLASYVTSSSTTVSLAAAEAAELAVMFTWTGSGDNLTGVTVNGSAATYIGQKDDGGQTIRAYYYVNPPTSSVNYVASTSNASEGVEMTVHLIKGAKQSALPDSSAGATGTTPLNLTTTVVASNCWLFAGVRNRTSGVDPTAGTGTTLRVNGVGVCAYDSNGTVGTGSQSLETTAASGTMFGFVVSIPQAGPSSYTLTAANGSIALSGKTALLSYARRITASFGSFVLNGYDATLTRFGWSFDSKPSGSFTNDTKPSMSYTNESKPSNSWTNQSR